MSESGEQGEAEGSQRHGARGRTVSREGAGVGPGARPSWCLFHRVWSPGFLRLQYMWFCFSGIYLFMLLNQLSFEHADGLKSCLRSRKNSNAGR